MIQKGLKLKIFQQLSRKSDFLGIYYDYDGILTFLNNIWPLREMPSTDSRYDNALEDARQHLVNNSDWTREFTFIDRFKLIDSADEIYQKFLETVVGPDVRGTKESVLEYVTEINSLISDTDHKLVHVDYFEELPVYKLLNRQEHVDLPLEISANSIPFFLDSSAVDEHPCFILRYNNWDDFNFKTSINLEFRDLNDNSYTLPGIKLMKRGITKTWDVIPAKFYNLGQDFCSLGNEIEYYRFFKNLLPGKYQSVLYGLRDVALFPKIAEQFENDGIFRTSLLRGNDSELLMRTARFILNDIDISQAFKFNYRYRPPYAENEVALNFDFQYTGELHHRIYGLIGKNGTGKTRILSSLVNALSEGNPSNITPKKPLYAKVFSVSFSFFDQFQIPEANASFNYVYCGLKRRGGGWLTEDELIARFFSSAILIGEKGQTIEWQEILKTFIPLEIVEEMFVLGQHSLEFAPTRFREIYKKVSSGQNILLFIITEIIAQIRYNSLIVYDEPETHLHPNAISELMNTIFELTARFNSFCIIATHSPIVIQELQSRNIYVVERDNNFATVRKLDKEAFGENLTVITEDIFGNRDVSKHYISVLASLVRREKTFDEIVSLLETDEVPLSLNARLFIKSLISENNEESDTIFR